MGGGARSAFEVHLNILKLIVAPFGKGDRKKIDKEAGGTAVVATINYCSAFDSLRISRSTTRCLLYQIKTPPFATYSLLLDATSFLRGGMCDKIALYHSRSVLSPY